MGERPVARRLPAVDQDDARRRVRVRPGCTSRAAAARRSVGISSASNARPSDDRASMAGGCAVRVAGPDPVDEREPVGRRERQRGERGERGPPGGRERGRDGERKAAIGDSGRAGALSSAGARRTARYTRVGAREGPPRRARRRARRQPRRHQGRLARASPGGTTRTSPATIPRARATRDPPDGRDQRRLRRADACRRDHEGRRAAATGDGANGTAGTAPRHRPRRRRGGPPAAGEADPAGHRPPRPQRHRPAAQPDDHPARVPHPADRPAAAALGPVRAGAPRLAAVGPDGVGATRRLRAARPPRRSTTPSCVEVDFGKFHGHTLGEIAAFEPSYIDWLAGTVTRDPELALAARVIREELDRRGIVRATARRGRAGSRTRSARRRRPGTRNAPGRYAGGTNDEASMSATDPRLGPAGRTAWLSARDRGLGSPGPSSVPNGRVVRSM